MLALICSEFRCGPPYESLQLTLLKIDEKDGERCQGHASQASFRMLVNDHRSDRYETLA